MGAGIKRVMERLQARVQPPPSSGGGHTPAPLTVSERPTPPDTAHDYILITLDSCRYDTFMKARPKIITKLGAVEKRYTYATWTAPSHYNLLMGLVPHISPPHVYASEYYKEDFLRFQDRLGVPDMEFARMVPRLFLPSYLRNVVGFRTNAYVSMPVLNPQTPINQDFDTYVLMDKHNDMRQALDDMKFYADRPSFFLINAGETHYPYADPYEDENDLPRISGVNGVFKHLDKSLKDGQLVHGSEQPKFFDDKKMKELKQRQVDVIKYMDRVFEQLYDIVPKGTHITITGDHGELFGEGGYFGHGPIMHKKVLEVPFLEGVIR